jgi:ABC-2 type transport system permease protein
MIAVALTVALLLVGLAVGIGAPSPASWAALCRQAALVLLTGAIAAPVAWVTTLARSTLGGVTAAIVIVVVAQVGVLVGAGGWMPFAAPTIWAMSGGTLVSFGQLAIAAAVALVFGALTVDAWRRLQLDR